MGQIAHFSAPQLQIIKTTVARDTNQSEFDLFMEACRSYGLDPFRKQIHAVVYNKDKPDKRKMTIIVSRDGLRVLASRCGDYRPASEPASIVYDKELVGPTNPKGILSATVKLWKQDKRGEWFPVIGEAYWDEFAPLSDEWAADPDTGRRAPTGKKTLDASGNWAKMPLVMITKCAESQALRAGWPETFGNIYSEEEMERLDATASASQAVEEYQRQEREKRVGGNGLLLVFDDAAKLEKVPMGQVMDRCIEFIQQADAEEAYKFRVRNEHSLRDFWAANPSDALELKKAIEHKEASK
jgi:phage recombination protein Bet